jgi:2-isopropylmalate synthase
MHDTSRVIIFDTTLRDGEQAPGASMSLAQKLEVAFSLQALKVDVLEAGFPSASDGDFEAVQAIARKIRGVTVCGLARALPADIARCWEALREAEKPRIHVFLATSPIHRKHKLKLSQEQVLKRAVDSVTFARTLCADVEFSAEDASRTEPDFLAAVVEGVIAAGATTVNIPDTVGYAVPEQFGAMISMLRQRVRNIEQAVLSVHCHDDLGFAVANSLAAVRAGARQVECTVNGVGERAGNASLEEVVMALQTRADWFGANTGIRTRELCNASAVVARATSFPVPRNKAVVGENAFAHESGIHQHGMIADASTYEIMKPQDVGRTATRLVLGKHSGRHSVRLRLGQLGVELEEPAFERFFERYKTLADRKKEVFDADLEAMVDQISGADEAGRWQLVSIHAVSGTNAAPSAAVSLQLRDGRKREDAAVGDGPVDAVFKAIERICGMRVKLKDFQICNMTPGEDAQGEVTIEVEHEGRTFRGRGVSTDIVVASAHAFLEVMNRAAAVRVRPSFVATDDVEVACGAV